MLWATSGLHPPRSTRPECTEALPSHFGDWFSLSSTVFQLDPVRFRHWPKNWLILRLVWITVGKSCLTTSQSIDCWLHERHEQDSKGRAKHYAYVLYIIYHYAYIYIYTSIYIYCVLYIMYGIIGKIAVSAQLPWTFSAAWWLCPGSPAIWPCGTSMKNSHGKMWRKPHLNRKTGSWERLK